MAENSQDRKASFIVSAENDTKSTFQEIKADAAEMAGSVEQAGERAARGVSSIGDGAEVAAQKLTREEGRMSSALIRATEQARIAAQAGTSMARAFELKADMRGMDMSRITPLAAELRKAEQALAEYKAQQAQAASQTSFIDSLRAQAEAVGKTRLELLELKAAQLGITTQASPYIAQLRNAENAQGRLGKTAGELQWALRGVPAQLSDIAVSIEGGMPLMTVFMQQGFQLRDMFGSWGAAGRGVTMSLIGMVTPLTAVSAGVLALTAAYYYGSKERDAFLRSLVMTGDAAGVSTDGLVIMSRQISDSVGTQAKATEALVAFVDAGVKGQSELRKYTQTAIEWERATGEGVDKTAAKFASLQEDPLTDSQGQRVLQFGFGLSDEQIDIEGLKAFMLHCAARGYTYDKWITSSMSLGAFCEEVALAGMGEFAWTDGSRPTAVFVTNGQPNSAVVNMANMLKGGFSVDYALSNAADGIEYQWLNRDTWEVTTLRVMAPGVTTMLSPARVTGEGITSEAHAAVMARYHLAQSLYQYKTVHYTADIEHLDYRRLSVLSVSHDLTQWGFGGRVMAAKRIGAQVQLTLDDPVGGALACSWWLAREHTQAEYRWIAAFAGGHRDGMPWWGGFYWRCWDWPSLLDAAAPAVGCLVFYLTASKAVF